MPSVSLNQIEQFAEQRAEDAFEQMSISMMLIMVQEAEAYELRTYDLEGETAFQVEGPGIPAPVSALSGDLSIDVDVAIEIEDEQATTVVVA